MGTAAEGRDSLGADKMIDKERFHAALKAKKGNEGNDESRSGRKQLEAFDRKQTNWGGLWFHSEYNGFSSEAINLAELRKFKGKVRLYVRKNKFFNNGENGRPNYCFCLKDADSETFWTPEIEEDEEHERTFTRSEVQEIINKVACYVGGDGEYGMHLVEDFI